jgi:hypothetical protein
MDDWLRTGRPPPLAAFAAAGYTGEPNRDLWIDRWTYVRRYGFSIPCAEAVEALLRLGPLVEIGAGSGSWSRLLASAGADIVATDIAADAPPHRMLTVGEHFPVLPLGAVKAARQFTDRAVFVSWPKRPWPARLVRELGPGRRIAIVGEGRGGVTGDDLMFDILDRDFEVVATVPVPRFPTCKDRLTIYERRALAPQATSG